MNCRMLVLTLMAIACCASHVFAQPDLSPQELAKKYQKSMANQQVMVRLISILKNKSLQEELEIPEYQLADLKTKAAEFQKEFARYNGENLEKMVELQEEMQSGDREAAMVEMQKIAGGMFDIADQAMGGIEDILLPHQVARIKQISRQEMLKFQSGFGDEFGVVYGLAKDLELTPEEKQKLRDSIVEARKEYYEKLAQLKADTHKKIMDSLPAEKRDKVKEILGDRYDGDSERRKMFERNTKPRDRPGD